MTTLFFNFLDCSHVVCLYQRCLCVYRTCLQSSATGFLMPDLRHFLSLNYSYSLIKRYRGESERMSLSYIPTIFWLRFFLAGSRKLRRQIFNLPRNAGGSGTFARKSAIGVFGGAKSLDWRQSSRRGVRSISGVW